MFVQTQCVYYNVIEVHTEVTQRLCFGSKFVSDFLEPFINKTKTLRGAIKKLFKTKNILHVCYCAYYAPFSHISFKK